MKQIPLTQGQFALVDDEDYERVNQFKWYYIMMNKNTGLCYARRHMNISGKDNIVYLHRFILGISNGKSKIDHKDGNGLNNQRSNIRISTHGQNLLNRGSQTGASSKYKGVCFENFTKSYRMQITIKGKTIRSRFKNEIEAAKEYDRLAKILHGEFANLNFK
jgi:hypothetical protein